MTLQLFGLAELNRPTNVEHLFVS